MSTKRQNPETIAIHGGDYRNDPTTKAVAVPIYRTTSYQFDIFIAIITLSVTYLLADLILLRAINC